MRGLSLFITHQDTDDLNPGIPDPPDVPVPVRAVAGGGMISFIRKHSIKVPTTEPPTEDGSGPLGPKGDQPFCPAGR